MHPFFISFLSFLSFLFLFLLAFLLSFSFNNNDIKIADVIKVAEIGWDDLSGYDFKAGKLSSELENKLKQNVKIAGFLVPLGGDVASIKEVLLVATRGACIHVPAPPPNLVIHVKLNKPMHLKNLRGPMWIFGSLEVETSKTEWATAGWKMESFKVEAYKKSR